MANGFRDGEKKPDPASEIHAMPDHRRSLVDFQRRFPGEAACSTCLATLRRREGFRLPSLAFMTGPGR